MPSPKPALPEISEIETKLLQTMNELQERLKVERNKSREIGELRAFIEKRPLLTRAVLWGFVKRLPVDKAKRSKHAVKSTRTKNAPKPENAQVAKAIQRAREGKSLSIEALADKMGVHSATIRWWEKAAGQPANERRAKVEKILGIKLPAVALANGHAQA